ncbi:hypothetical protein ACFWZU_07460 [Frateuria sp. GZRR33]|uniref:hypothetical protein n=1 Tax=Frateuria sp. GZRR33 TaxID=3351535 RepID=UPI003EDBEF89
MQSVPFGIIFFNWMPLLFFAAGGLGALGVVLRYNVITRGIVANVQEVAVRYGRRWLFWEDWRATLNFLIAPHRLLDVDDPPAIRDEKQRLLAHRALLGKYLLVALAIALAGVVLAIASLVIVGELAQP